MGFNICVNSTICASVKYNYLLISVLGVLILFFPVKSFFGNLGCLPFIC